ncbi:MAG: helix-turn-helix transcriptional regulator [Oscillospiraceae bacterium]|nr:helix-turn-helix transcriptional regulator [Oscillospiraceae bacterium]
MKLKNRFSSLLEHLMEIAELKNYTLANELQYDVSYISKWVSGRMLPSAKTDRTVLQGISRCLVNHGSADGVRKLMAEYQVNNSEDLYGAIYDNLVAEYNYVRDTQNDTGNTIAPDTSFFPRLNMPQFLSKMRHPVLRRVNSLEIMSMMDLMYMERDYRLQIGSIDSRVQVQQFHFPDVHLSMFIDINNDKLDHIYDITFLLNMLTNMTHVDFQLFGGKQAFGKAIFAVKDEFCISGMLTDSNHCMSVTVSEDQENSNAMYEYIRSLCTRERQLFVQVPMPQLLSSNSYTQSVLSTNQKLRIGHMTERFLPDDLFEELIVQLTPNHKEVITVDNLRWIHTLTNRSYGELPVQVIFNSSAFSEFAVSGNLNFFDLNVKLTPEQRLRYVSHVRDLIRDHENLAVRMVHGRIISDFYYNADQCITLSDSSACVQLSTVGRNAVYLINHAEMKEAFVRYFDAVWNYSSDVVMSDRQQILDYLEHIMHQIEMIARLSK